MVMRFDIGRLSFLQMIGLILGCFDVGSKVNFTRAESRIGLYWSSTLPMRRLSFALRTSLSKDDMPSAPTPML
jgi:hypothetical protein